MQNLDCPLRDPNASFAGFFNQTEVGEVGHGFCGRTGDAGEAHVFGRSLAIESICPVRVEQLLC